MWVQLNVIQKPNPMGVWLGVVVADEAKESIFIVFITFDFGSIHMPHD